MPHETDLGLAPQDIAKLTSADALAGFCTSLGYDTGARAVLTPEAIGLSSAGAGPIEQIELLSEDAEGFLRVVFVRLHSLTAKSRNDLARTLGRTNVDHLLILASDFDILEFVLLDKRRREHPGAAGLARLQVIPRTFSVNRRSPGRLEMRALRRLTWTGADGLEQYEKLRAAFEAAAFTEEHFQNRALFADHYLMDRLPDAPAWKENPSEAFHCVRDLLRDHHRRFAGKGEGTVRHGLFEPVFSLLGFAARQNKVAGSDQIKPDYLLGAGSAKPLTAAFVYAWDRWLDGPDLGDQETPEENPGACVVSALEGGVADWIIVTNGRLWRLYSRQAHSRATNFYEVDLVETLASSGDTDPNEAFRYWWLFFRRQAFEPAKVEPAGCWLDGIVQGSRDYAKRLGERLKDRIFETIFPHLAQGFLIDRRKRLGLTGRPTDEELADTFEATLTLLYRLLFLLYAESRDLLPIREAPYYAASLKKIKEEIAERAGVAESEAPQRIAKAYAENDYGLYERVTRLCQSMDRGDAALNVPIYNGGLFITNPPPLPLGEGRGEGFDTRDQRIARFLLEHKVPDRCLALAVDRLARDRDDKTFSLVFIDYKSLEVRHLGSIYEGLLEFKLKVAEEDLATKTEKKREKYIPLAKAKPKRGKKAEVAVRRGQVYLSNDKAERKATGSYYTPDPIVEYIVEHTVGPVLDEGLEALRPRFRTVRKTFNRELDKAKAYPVKRPSGETRDPREFALEKVYATHKDLFEDLFEFRTLDPAMGSGHFLVEAVDFITDRVLTFLNQFPINPVSVALVRTRRNILEALGEQGVSVDSDKLTEVNLLKRHVLKRCIYGVDLNPMAVELAKVSLWLDAFTLGAPLSFLDHHLRCGNSLIGATFKDLEKATKHRPLLKIDYQPLTEAIRQVIETNRLADATAAEVKQSAAGYEAARTRLSGYATVFHLLIAEHFGVDGASGLVSEGDTLNLCGHDTFVASLHDDAERRVVSIVEELARRPDLRFFHWEIEFPEVFFKFKDAEQRHIERKDRISAGTAGFDAVVGNPPWGGLRTLGDLGSYLKSNFVTARKAADWFALFVEASLRHVRENGYYGAVIPSGWQTAVESVTLRSAIACRWSVTGFVNLPYDTFPEAYTEAAIAVGKVTSGATPAWKTCEPAILIMDHQEKLSAIDPNDARWFRIAVREWFALAPDSYPFYTFWTPVMLAIARKVAENSRRLDTFCDVQRGITPFETVKGAENARFARALDGELRRYSYSYSGCYVVEYHPGIAEYKEPEWFLGRRGIVRQLISRQFRIQAVLTDEPFVVNQSHQVVRPIGQESVDFVVGVVNSRLLSYLQVNKSALAQRDDFPKLVLEDTRSLPLPNVSPDPQGDPTILRALEALPQERQALRRLIRETPARKIASLVAASADAMMRLSSRLRETTHRFIGQLASHLGQGAEDRGLALIEKLTGKTTLLAFAGDYQRGETEVPFEELVQILRRNRRHVPMDAHSAGAIEALREQYEEAVAEACHLKNRLSETDLLLDEMVYRLFGLDDEEILIVDEGI